MATYFCDDPTFTMTWNQWVGETASTIKCYVTYPATFVWKTWNSESASTSMYFRVDGIPAADFPIEETAESRAICEEREAEFRRQWEAGRHQREAEATQRLQAGIVAKQECQAAKDAADQRAADLLQEHLNTAQKQQYAKDRSFVVVTESGRRYRLRSGWAGNVEEIDEAGKATARYCIHPSIGVPHPDNQLVQKLLLETDEARFLKIANRTNVA